MSYSVIARKWRPATFDEVIGQEAVIQTLKNSIAEGRIHHSLIFSGLRGTGKTSTARIYAKALNCKNGPTVEPCLECDACKEIAEGRDIDVMEIDAASNKGVDDIRNLKEIVQYPPIRDRYRVFIIDEVHMLSTHAFNALLKTIEEPPSYVVFILATTEPHKIPATIRSRCQIFEFKKIPPVQIIRHLKDICDKEGIDIEESALKLIVDASEGSMRDAQSLLDQIVSFSGGKITEEDVSIVLGVPDSTVFFKIFKAIVNDDRKSIVDILDKLEERNTDFVKFVLRLGEFFNNLLHAIVNNDKDFFPEELKEKKFSVEDVIRYLNVILQNERFVRESFNPRIAVELLLFKMVFASKVMPISELISKKKLINKTTTKTESEKLQNLNLDENQLKENHSDKGDDILNFVRKSFEDFEEIAPILRKAKLDLEGDIITVNLHPLPNSVKELIENKVFKSIEGNAHIKFQKRIKLNLEISGGNNNPVSESEKIANHPLVKKILEEFEGRIERIIK
ncbi:DNA polymerase III subunit gamma/tau [Thermotomaculum hydrothermale]|nr:DNA polymerase III subunit gamma/tau [Thermotomaculum hydrothermale]